MSFEAETGPVGREAGRPAADGSPAAIRELERLLRTQVDALDIPRIVAELAEVTGWTPEQSERRFRDYVGEAFVALRLVGPHLRAGQRLLEVGSGVGLFARFLSSLGRDIVELEPVGRGFDFIQAARGILADEQSPPHLDIGVEELDPALHGRFDLVYSLNVLEHVPDWRGALDRSYGVLADGGTMLQSCVNYAVPYEPHFGIPLVPLRPAWTEHLLPKNVTESDLWCSLNWVTYRQVRAWADDRAVAIAFTRGKLAEALDRLSDDPTFRGRHGRTIAAASALVHRLHLVELLRRLPPGLATPMEFSVIRGHR